MALVWTIEKLSALPPQRLEAVRQNANKLRDHGLVALCEELQSARRRKRTNSSASALSPVIGFHFVCDSDYEVEENPDGTFWSGNWAISESHCGPAIEMKGYVALHASKRDLSYRQGQIIGWEFRERTKGKRQQGIAFLLKPLSEPLNWHGEGSGEKGYRRAEDTPKWNPES